MKLKISYYGNDYKLLSISFNISSTGLRTYGIKYFDLSNVDIRINTRLTYRNLNFITIFAR